MKKNTFVLILIAFSLALNVNSQTADNKRSGGKVTTAADSKNDASTSAKSVPDVIDAVKRFVPQPTGADILFNPKGHVLIVKNTRENLDQTEDLLSALDVRPVQVLIETRFMDVNVSDLRELGVDWILNGNLKLGNNSVILGSANVPVPGSGSTTTTFTPGLTTANGSSTLAGEGLNLTYQGLLDNAQFQAVLHALEQSGKGKTLSVPRVTAMNNSTANIRIGDNFLYIGGYAEEQFQVWIPGTPDGHYDTQYRFVPSEIVTEPLGYTLIVTPSVGADLATINLKVVPKWEGFKEWNTFTFPDGIIQLPVFTVKKIETEVNVQSGETIVMGGLANTTHTKNQTGTPFLSSLPWIGQLFRSNADNDTVDNLIIFVTATIISDTGEQLVPLNASEPVGLPLPAGVK